MKRSQRDGGRRRPEVVLTWLDCGAAAGAYNTFIDRHWTGSVHLTVLDVPHVKMDAGHQDTNSLGALVAQQLHHLRGENSGVITVLLHKLLPTAH